MLVCFPLLLQNQTFALKLQALKLLELKLIVATITEFRVEDRLAIQLQVLSRQILCHCHDVGRLCKR